MTPFPYIPIHVVQTKGVGFFLPDGVRLSTGIRSEPGILAEFHIVVSETEPRSGTRATAILPLSFGGQSIWLPFFHTCSFLLKLLLSNQFEQAPEEVSDFPRQRPPTTHATNF